MGISSLAEFGDGERKRIRENMRGAGMDCTP